MFSYYYAKIKRLLNKSRSNENESTNFDSQQTETAVINAIISCNVHIGQILFVNRIETNADGIKTIYLAQNVIL